MPPFCLFESFSCLTEHEYDIIQQGKIQDICGNIRMELKNESVFYAKNCHLPCTYSAKLSFFHA